MWRTHTLHYIHIGGYANVRVYTQKNKINLKEKRSTSLSMAILRRGPLRRSTGEVLLFVAVLLLLLRTVRRVRRRAAPTADFDHVMRSSPVLDRLIRRLPVFLLFEVLPVVVVVVVRMIAVVPTDVTRVPVDYGSGGLVQIVGTSVLVDEMVRSVCQHEVLFGNINRLCFSHVLGRQRRPGH